MLYDAKAVGNGDEAAKKSGHNLTRRMENSTLKMCEEAARRERFCYGRP